MIDSINAPVSASGDDIHTPSRSKNLGSIRTNGMNIITCLDKVNSVDCLGFPVA